MTDAVFDFKSIARKLNRMDQKAEHDSKEAEKATQAVGWPMFGVVPYALSPELESRADEVAQQLLDSYAYGTAGVTARWLKL